MLQDRLEEILSEIADLGFAYTINQEEKFKSSYPTEWLEVYILHQYNLVDPIVAWAAQNVGWLEWRDIPVPDLAAANFMKHAASLGYRYGAVYSTVANGAKCSLSICTSKETLTDAEKREVQAIFDTMARLHPPQTDRSTKVMPDKARIYISLSAAGLSDSEISAQMGKSERTIKEYRKQALTALSARTLPQGTALASSLGLA